MSQERSIVETEQMAQEVPVSDVAENTPSVPVSDVAEQVVNTPVSDVAENTPSVPVSDVAQTRVCQEDEDIKTLISDIANIDPNGWEITDQKGDLYCINSKDQSIRGLVVDVSERKVVVPSIPHSSITANEIIVSVRGLSLIENGRTNLLLPSESIRYEITEGREGVVIRHFTHNGVSYLSTYKKLHANEAMWKGKSFLAMFDELRDFTLPRGDVVTNFIVTHPSLQNLLHDDIGIGKIENLHTEIPALTAEQASNVLYPSNFPDMTGGLVFINGFDENNNVVHTYEVRSPGYNWRFSLRGPHASDKAALYRCIDTGSRPRFTNGYNFADKFFIFMHMNKERLDMIVDGRYKLDTRYVQAKDKAPNFLCTRKDSTDSDEKNVFLNRLQIVIANFLYCIPPSRRSEFRNVVDNIFKEVRDVVNLVINIRDERATLRENERVPKRITDLTKIWKDDRRPIEVLVMQLLLTERGDSLYKMVVFTEKHNKFENY